MIKLKQQDHQFKEELGRIRKDLIQKEEDLKKQKEKSENKLLIVRIYYLSLN